MDKKSLKMLNLQVLNKLLGDFGNGGRIFNSEAQFQFELAWRLNEVFDCHVVLEGLSREYKTPNKRTKKDYTDIILEKDDYRIAIELKYKTAKLDKYSLSEHGAYDLGAYDFMWDVNRLQMLTAQPKNETVKMSCNRGYAVILTNDYHYWTEPNNKNTINRCFLIYGNTQGKGGLTKGLHQWYNTMGQPGLSKALKNDTSRQKEITLRRDYPYQWMRYSTVPNEKNGVFQFMIVEIG